MKVKYDSILDEVREDDLGYVTAPVNSDDTGTAGQLAYDSTFFYVCVASNTWKRTLLSDWGGTLLLESGDRLLIETGDQLLKE